MDQVGQPHPPPPGLRQINLMKSFKLGIRSLLTTCSKEEFFKAFSTFNRVEQEGLHRLFIQVVTSLHENIEEEFELLCLETQAGATLDTVEQLVEEQSLDTLFAHKTNVGEVKQELSKAKKDEIQYLMKMVDSVVEQNHLMRARVESLKKERQDLSVSLGAADKLRSLNLDYGHIK
ncbi:uncharacterized protein LOC122063586 [Macadamia integrifolia]|uniref:uncharacterized protein LOC122063586 n=1 Tax=Macadamia integrifolia TaxID=60698 RepID=UPI001C4FBCD0|nr:uncharacterized protein LOC122063586 [Macadamia integrifolia]XP_042483226.1 uncharacterized protein LOC122063586 [Macadamia integrifolia]XP_042483227.1 uncharacterized protein LOC122063586 [Macadamia integrifolia]